MPDEKPQTDSALVELNARLRADNHKLREKRRQLETEKAELEKKLGGAALPEGAVVLKPEEAKQWEAFQALKLEPAKLQEALTERDTLKGQLAERDREALLRDAADAVGYNAKVLADQVRLKELHVEMREVDDEESGGKKKVPHVRPAKDDKAQLEALTKYAERELNDYLPALTATESKGNGTQDRRTAPSGPTYPQQRPTGSAGGKQPDRKDLAAQKHADVGYAL